MPWPMSFASRRPRSEAVLSVCGIRFRPPPPCVLGLLAPRPRHDRRSLSPLFAAVAALGLIAHLIPLWDAVLGGAAAHPLDRARPLPLGRFLQANHDLAARRGMLPHLDALAAAPAPAHLPRPSPLEVQRLDDAGSPGWHPSADGSPDLSRSPPGR